MSDREALLEIERIDQLLVEASIAGGGAGAAKIGEARDLVSRVRALLAESKELDTMTVITRAECRDCGQHVGNGHAQGCPASTEFVYAAQAEPVEYVRASEFRGAVSEIAGARSLLHAYALGVGSTDGLVGVFDALNAALTRLGGQ